MPKRSICAISLIAAALVLGCGNGGGGSGGTADAPASLDGRTIDVDIKKGSGAFASKGSFRVSFAATTYALQGDGNNVGNSSGTYTYFAAGSVGTAPFFDSVIGGGHTFAFTYKSSSKGTYTISGLNGSQSGNFTER